MRKDADRNRDRLIAAAREVMRAEGSDVPMEVIAERAGLTRGDAVPQLRATPGNGRIRLTHMEAGDWYSAIAYGDNETLSSIFDRQ